jgi:hypothetical protein
MCELPATANPKKTRVIAAVHPSIIHPFIPQNGVNETRHLFPHSSQAELTTSTPLASNTITKWLLSKQAHPTNPNYSSLPK